MNLNNFSDIKSEIEEVYRNRTENFLDLVIESKISGMALLKLVKETQIKFFGKQIKDSIVYVTYSEKVYNYVKLRLKDFIMIKEIKLLEKEDDLSFYTNSSMKFDKIIMNPPFSKGGEIWDKVRELSPNPIVCLGPFSMYSDKNRVEYLDTIVNVDCNGFKGAQLTDNLCITTSRKTSNESASYVDLALKYLYDTNFYDYYVWNMTNFKNITLLRKDNTPKKFFDEDTDFLTTNRNCGRYHKFSNTNDDFTRNWNFNKKRDITIPSGIAYSRFASNKALENFISFVYYDNGKLINNAMWGLKMETVSALCGYAIPQIDWEDISNHPLWAEGKYDEAVLDTMGLKWNDTMTGVIKK